MLAWECRSECRLTPCKPNLAHQLGNASTFAIRRIILATGLAEDEVVLGIGAAEQRPVFALLGSVLHEHLERPFWHRDVARFLRFCGLYAKTGLRLFERFRDIERPALNIEIGPLKRKQFAAATARCRCQDDKRIQPRVARAIEKSVQLRFVEHREVSTTVRDLD